MKHRQPVEASAVTNRCPACGQNITLQRDILPFKRRYLCEWHAALFDAALAHEEAREMRKAAR